jgi:2-isopropylmalate synthase
MQMRKVYFSDTTLRDGEQMPGASLSPAEKVRIAKALAGVGVVSLDAGFPASSRSDVEGVRRIAAEVENIGVSALCRTLRADIDKAREAFEGAAPQRCCVSLFVGTSPSHRELKLRRSKDEILGLVRGSVEYARTLGVKVAFSPEDASRTEPDFLNQVYREAIDAGAHFLGFPDTVGILTPQGVCEALHRIFDGVPNLEKTALAVHFHNDLGLATANTLTAFQQGAPVAQCTVNGLGERAGNTALEEVAMAIALHGAELGLSSIIRIAGLHALGQLTSELTGIPIPANKPVMGANIFATEAGIHQDGLLKNPETYLPFLPEAVGGPQVKMILGRHSGRAAFANRLVQLGLACEGEELEALIELAKEAPKEAWLDPDGLLRASWSTAQSMRVVS